TGELVSWVNVTSISSSSDTKIWMYYNNSGCSNQENVTGTWDSNYMAVYHLDESDVQTIDSTYTANASKKSASEPTQNTSGKIGNAQEFTGGATYTDDYIEATNYYDSMTDLTCSFWLHRPDNELAEYNILGNRQGHSTGNSGFSFLKRTSGAGNEETMQFRVGNVSGTVDIMIATDCPTEEWAYVTGRIDSGICRIYINAVAKGSTADIQDNIGLSGHPFRIGMNGNSEGPFVGTSVDEVRISNVPRSTSWITTCYNTMTNTTTFVSADSEENKGWVTWNDTSNPDLGSPWSWNFDFPNSTGYYEFYSIASDNSGNGEDAPDSADAICLYNNVPTQTGENPSDNSGNIEPSQATVNVTINDPDEDTFNWTIQGQYITNTGANGASNGSKSANTITPLPYNTNIIWYVNVTDGHDWTNATYNFTVREEYVPDAPGSFTATMISSSQIDLAWSKGNKADYTRIQRKTGSYPTSVSDGTNVYNNTGTSHPDTSSLSEGTTYYYRAWSWNTTDSVWSTSNASAYNTTNNIPTIASEGPGNGSTGISLTPQMNITINDLDGDSMTLTWYSNSSDSWQPFGTNTSCSNGTYHQTNSNFSNYGKTYYWNVSVNDGTDTNTSATYHFTTEVINTSVDGISPYEQTSSTLALTATAEHDNYDNVTLWYRYSSDNSSWANDSNWYNGWTYRKKLTIDHNQVNATLSNFPILYSITDTDLAGGAQNDGDDIVFTNATGTKLNHEIELFNGTTGALVAWVNVTSISSTTNTSIYMYYGNNTCSSQQNVNSTWDANYTCVLHLNETTGTHQDSTSNDLDGVMTVGSGSQTATGKIAGCNDFDASSLKIASTSTLDDALQNQSSTLEIWEKLDSTSVADMTFFGAFSSSSNRMYWRRQTTAGIFRIYYSIDGTATGVNSAENLITDTNWHYVTFGMSGTPQKVYVDGVYKETMTTTANLQDINDGFDFYVGDNDGTVGSYIFTGLLDEFRLSNIERNASWITTSYNTITNTTTFVTSSSEEAWMEWDNATQNPDENPSPWNWTFNYPNGTGYYEFYSIGKKNGSTDETAPNSADAICLYDNVKPAIEFIWPTPDDGNQKTDTYAYINVSVTDESNNISSFIDWNNTLVGYWNFEYTNSTGIYDNSTNSNFGTFNGGLSESNITDGEYGNALEFNGSSDYVNCGNDISLQVSGNVTVAAWIKPASGSSTLWQRIVTAPAAFADNAYAITYQQAGIYSRCIIAGYGGAADANQTTYYTPTDGITPNVWTHVIM
ncbi:protein of unknown function (DUF2341), partial [Thermoplasmatales archaeon SCGC AB-539-N05]